MNFLSSFFQFSNKDGTVFVQLFYRYRFFILFSSAVLYHLIINFGLFVRNVIYNMFFSVMYFETYVRSYQNSLNHVFISVVLSVQTQGNKNVSIHFRCLMYWLFHYLTVNCQNFLMLVLFFTKLIFIGTNNETARVIKNRVILFKLLHILRLLQSIPTLSLWYCSFMFYKQN